MKIQLEKKKVIRTVIAFAVATLVNFVIYYLTLPPLNGYSKSFWFFLTVVLFVYGIALGAIRLIPKGEEQKRNARGKGFFGQRVHVMSGKMRFRDRFGSKRYQIIYAIIIPIPLVFMILGSIFSSSVFNAKKYASVIEVKEEVFSEDMPEVNQVTNIALLDTEAARKLGTKELGSLSEVVSQFVVSNEYTQINFQNHPMKVANLEYDGFFKWINNRSEGVPGYIMVDAVGNDANYCPLTEKMHYTESAYFGEDLERKLRFDYPTKIFDNISFEVDEEGKAYFVVSCASPKVGLFGAMDISEVILFDPVDGSSEIMDVEKVPTWIDIVYDGYLACEKFDWQGIYAGGFFNSIIGQKGCKQTTDDFGYLMLDDDVWYFTGVTSVIADESNIGFILSCARTGEYKFYSVIGAEEHSAMGAAEGEVQEKGYVASFPALVNIAGEPTYIMVLKDANLLVKLYALVNVEQYNIVATGETQADTVTAYLKLLAQNGVDTSGSSAGQTVEITVSEVKYLTMSGVPYVYVYLTDSEGRIFRVEFNAANEGIIFVKEGSRLTLGATKDEKSGIYIVHEWKFTE